jgi:asparagine synthase (glutamine-hydrolysing)
VTDDPLPATLFIDGQLALVDDMLQYFDRTSMAHSLEVRVPFLDHELVEFCARIPARHKVRGLTTKHVLKTAARGLVEDDIIDKRKIDFFRGPSGGWLDAQLPIAVQRYLQEGSPRCAEFLDLGVVSELVADYAAGRGRGRVQLLLGILMLEVWLTEFLPRAATPPAPERLPAAA